jgi:hypothetical protein
MSTCAQGPSPANCRKNVAATIGKPKLFPRLPAASPAAGVVAADDGAFGQRAHLLGDGQRQGRIERPRDRPAAPARAHRPRRSGPQSLDVRLERDDGERGGIAVHDRDRIGVRERALRRAELRGPRAHRGCYEVGADGVRVGRGHLDVHRGGIVGAQPRPDSRPMDRDALARGTMLPGGRCGEIRWDPNRGERLMVWIKPKFEFVDLCSEVTSYLHQR